MLSMLDNLEALRDAPRTIDRLVHEKRYVAAVAHFNRMHDLMFSEDLIGVSALTQVRNEIHMRKVRLLDMIVSEVQELLFRLPAGAGAGAGAAAASEINDVTTAPLEPNRAASEELEKSLSEPASDPSLFLELLMEVCGRACGDVIR